MMKKWAVMFVLILAATCLAGYRVSFAAQGDDFPGLTGDESLESRYLKAQLLFSQNRFAEAAAMFYELGGYEDSAKLTIYCKAAAAGEDGNYGDAFTAFEMLGDYKESKLMLVYYKGRMYESFAEQYSEYAVENLCEAANTYRSVMFFRDTEERIEKCRRAIYDSAVMLEQEGKYESAKSMYEWLGDYLDVKDRLASVEKKIILSKIQGLCPEAVAEEKNRTAEEMISEQYPYEYPYINEFSAGINADGEIAGYIVSVTEKGFGGDLTMKIGFTPEGSIRKIVFTELNEIAGMGMRADEDWFKDQFTGKSGGLVLSRTGAQYSQEIDALSGSTVTSKAVVSAVNAACDFLHRVTGMEKTASSMGFGGDVTVYAVSDGAVVLSLRIEAPNETPGLGQKVMEEKFTGQFIGKEGPFEYGENGIDAVTGATFTSNAVLKAINEALGFDTPRKTGRKENAETTPEPQVFSGRPEAKAPADFGRGFYGSYLMKKETNFSTIRVFIDIRDGQITDCRIESEAKSAGSDFLTDEIKAEWAKAIVENGTAETDVITGATLKFSAGAVTDAVNEFLANIGQR